MTTLLDNVLKRELTIRGEPYTLTISPEGFSLTVKGRRNGLDIAWADLIGGDAALATALNASLTANLEPRGVPAAKGSGKRSKTVEVDEPRVAAAKLFQLNKAAEKSIPARSKFPATSRSPAAATKPRVKVTGKTVKPRRRPAAKVKRK